MPPLRELQLRFAANLLDPAGRYAAAHVLEGAIAADERIGFYRTNVISNYRDTLRAVYPVVESLVGSRFFDHAADRYLRVHPSTSGDLNRFGGQFADFLETYPPAHTLEYLADVARLEWLVEESFHAAERPRFALSELAAVPPDRQELLTFTLHPACRLLASAFPVQRIWEMHQPGWQGGDSIDPGEGGVLLLVRRDNHQVTLETLDHVSFCMLSLLGAGRNVDEAFRYASSVQENFDLAAFLQHCVANGVLVDFDWPLIPEQPAAHEDITESLRVAA